VFGASATPHRLDEQPETPATSGSELKNEDSDFRKQIAENDENDHV